MVPKIQRIIKRLLPHFKIELISHKYAIYMRDDLLLIAVNRNKDRIL